MQPVTMDFQDHHNCKYVEHLQKHPWKELAARRPPPADRTWGHSGRGLHQAATAHRQNKSSPQAKTSHPPAGAETDCTTKLRIATLHIAQNSLGSRRLTKKRIAQISLRSNRTSNLSRTHRTSNLENRTPTPSSTVPIPASTNKFVSTCHNTCGCLKDRGGFSYRKKAQALLTGDQNILRENR